MNNVMCNYDPKDPSEALKEIFKKTKDSIRMLLDFDSGSLSEELDTTKIKLESPYTLVAKHVINQCLLLLNFTPSEEYCSRTYSQYAYNREPQFSRMQSELSAELKQGDLRETILFPLGVNRSLSLQNYIKDAKTNDEIKEAVEKYLNWKNQKRGAVEKEENLTSLDSSPWSSLVSLVKSNYDPILLKKASKIQKYRASLRLLGLEYQYKLMELLRQTPFMRLVIGNLTESFITSPFWYIESCGTKIYQEITLKSKNLLEKTMEMMIGDAELFKNITRIVQQKLRRKKDSKHKSSEENFIYEHMKMLALIFSDIRILMKEDSTDIFGQNKELPLASSSDSLKITKNFLSSIVKLILMSQEPITNQKVSAFAKLNSYLISACQVILNRFLSCKNNNKISTHSLKIQQILLHIFIDSLERECFSRKILWAFYLCF